jgi:hypothetical protein
MGAPLIAKIDVLRNVADGGHYPQCVKLRNNNANNIGVLVDKRTAASNYLATHEAG